MKKIVIAALSTAALAAAVIPAMAQAATGVTGTVNITGTVTSKCLVTAPGSTPGPDFGGNVNLGDLATGTGGTLTPGLAVTATANQTQFRVICTSANTQVSVTANPLITGTGTGAPSGYANHVNYNSHVAFALVGGTQTVDAPSTGTAVTPAAYSDRLATGATNVTVTADTFATPALTDVMMVGSYAGSIVVTITPA